MTKEAILRMKKAVRNCIVNAELLLWGDESSYPTESDIVKANNLIDTAIRLDAIISEHS